MKRLALLLGVFALTGTGLHGQARAGKCSVSSVKFDGWNAEQVVNPWLKLTFVPELGGRLMQVEFNGHAYLFVNPKYRGQYISPEQAAGDWINYGGDKIWPMPEGNEDEHHWVLVSTAIDDLPYRFKVLSQGKRCAVELTGQPDTITGLQYSRTISISADSPQINFHAVMKNATAHPIEWSVQSVTQYDLSDAADRNNYNRNFWAYTPVNPNSTYPGGFHVRDGLASDPSFSIKDGLFQLHWMYFENEVWLDSPAGWLAIADKQSQYGMVERFTFQPEGNYPDRETVIFYKNGPSVRFDKDGKAEIRETTPEKTPYYMEAELNSPIVRLQPDETYAMDTVWNPVRMSDRPLRMTDAGVVIDGLKVATLNGSTSLTGSFSAFYAGDLSAIFFNRRGMEIGRQVLMPVDPANAVVLNKQLSMPPRTSRVVLKLFGKDGVDYGTLDESRIDVQGVNSR